MIRSGMRRYVVAAVVGLALLAPAAALALDPTPSSPTDTSSASPTDTGTPSPTDTGTPSPSDTGTPSPSPTDTGTPSPTPTDTGTPSPTPTASPSPTNAPGLIVTLGLRVLRSPVHAYVVGDSLTRWGSPELAQIRPAWSINGVPGRRVSQLPLLIRSILAVDAHPRLVVVALGSNPTSGWSEADYARAVAALPASTKVVYVTTYIAPWAPRRPASSKAATRRYAAWMGELAAQRPHTCTAPWDVVARRHQGWLIDGLHETTLGYLMRAQLIVRTSERCR